MKTAIIDIGTNTTMLLIVETNSDSPHKTLHDECRITRLGEGLSQNPVFLPAAMQRCLEALKDYKKILHEYLCDSCHVVGTAAFRQAKNAKEFIRQVDDELHFKIKILSGEEEARLIHLACAKDFSHLKKPILVVDIGGGSTEFIFDDGKKIQALSLPFGVVKLTEQFLHSDPPTDSEMAQLESFLKKQITENFKSFTNRKKISIIATAGTPTTLKALELGLHEYNASLVHGQPLMRNDVDKIFLELKNLPQSERAKLPCLPEKRADVILAGTVILLTVLDELQLKKFWVSDRGLRFGVLYKNAGVM